MEFFTIGLLVILFILSVLVSVRNARPKLPVGTKDVPTVPGLPLIGNLVEFVRAGDNSLPVFEKYLYVLGKIYRMNVMGLDFVIVNDPEYLKHLLVTKFGDVYQKGEEFQEQYHDFLGKGIFVSNGDQWKMHRQVASALFQTSELKRHTVVFKKQAHTLVKKLNTLKGSIDMQDYFMRYTLDSFSEIGFGVQVKSIDQDDNRFQTAFDYVQFETDRRGTMGKLWRYIPDKRYKAELKYMDDFIENIISARRNESIEELHQKKDLLSQVMTKTDEHGKRLYDEEGLRDFVMNFLIAGRDTTAMTLTWCFYLLSQNPEVEKKMIEEMESILGPSPANPEDTSRGEPEIDWENLKKLKYVKAVLYETLRLFPPVPVDGYQACKDDVMPGGYFIPKGTVVLYSAYTLQRHPDYFPEPEKFKPERFENTQPPAYSWVPFHGGPRLCLGQEMAIIEAKIFLCIFMWRYRQSLRLASDANVELKRGIILTAKHGMKMNLTRRN
eukprot:TRINITY_DN57_c0_g1_i1.p1 TRINITY_DN57_c0_g1~~TRINITY_DN57_c0_g1_i1.p1  ORF type:complete len:496 (-),score=123.72 TRINITY_DN57_c0_g1_i1:44-1531(-)